MISLLLLFTLLYCWLLSRDGPKTRQIVFHVGPPKMGSTSIQMGAIDRYRKVLTRRDGYAIYSTKDTSNLNQCLSRNWTLCLSSKSKNNAWEQFTNFLQSHSNKNILLSTENYWNHAGSEPLSFLQAYKDVFVDDNVTIVLAYRDLYRYWHSSYYQTFRSGYCGYSKHPSKMIPSILDFYQRANETYGLVHPTFGGLKHFSAYNFTNIRIISLEHEEENDDDSLVTRFICNYVVGAVSSCEAAKIKEKNQEQNQHYNIGHGLVWERLAQVAQQHNISTKGCKTIARELETSFDQQWNNLPMICLSKIQQEWFLQRTIDYHRQLFPSIQNEDDTDQLIEQRFRQMMNVTLCDVNVELILVNWHIYFGNIT